LSPTELHLPLPSKALLKAGADPEAKTKDGKRPIDLAKKGTGSPEAIRACVTYLVHWARIPEEDRESEITRPKVWESSYPASDPARSTQKANINGPLNNWGRKVENQPLWEKYTAIAVGIILIIIMVYAYYGNTEPHLTPASAK